MTDDRLFVPVVIIISSADDAEALWVSRALSDRGAQVFWCDTADFPTGLAVSATGPPWTGSIRLGGQRVRLAEVNAAYFRRPGPFVFPDGMSDSERVFSTAEAWLGFGGLLAVQPWHWINHPAAIADAEFKPGQLARAQAHGLNVPRTLLTNRPDAAVKFANEVTRPILCKPFSTGMVPESTGLSLIYAHLLTQADLRYPGIAATMHLFQEQVPKGCDVRVTAIGDRVFAAAIHSSTAEAPVDFRSDYASLTYEVIDVPSKVRSGISAYLREAGLRFAACDFVIDQADQWWFLEANPNGMWAWIEERTGLPIAAAIADELLAGPA